MRNFLVANALYWLEEFHVDGLRVDAVASMLYLDYSREDGEWVPNVHGGRENLEAISFLQEANATAYKRNPGIVMIAEESTSWPGVTRPTAGGGLGFGLKWNMGWMHDSLQYMHAGPDVAGRPPQRHHLLVPVRVQRELPAADQPRRGRARQGLAAAQDAGRPVAEARQRARLPRVHVGAPGQAAALHGLASSGSPPSGAEQRGLDWWILDQPAHQGLQRLVGALNRLYSGSPALWEQDNAEPGFEWITSDPGAQRRGVPAPRA